MRILTTIAFILFFLWFGSVPAAALPVRVETASKKFSIPFEIQTDSSPDPVREVELLVSEDFGTHWKTAGKIRSDAKKFEFNAEKDGEYWFAFRTITLSGTTKQATSGPQLRVLVNSARSATATENVSASPQVQTAQEPQVLTPPKPIKMAKTASTPSPAAGEQGGKASKTATVPQKEENQHRLPTLISPDGQTAPTRHEAEKPPMQQADVVVNELLNGMGQFYGEMPPAVAVKRQGNGLKGIDAVPALPNVAVAANAAASVSTTPTDGKITGITMNTSGQKPQIVVKWNNGTPPQKMTQVDVLRRFEGTETFVPIAINLENNGQYWWFASPDDLKPFYLQVRLRSPLGIQTDTTPSPICIPK
jgi:hypothetical protein